MESGSLRRFKIGRNGPNLKKGTANYSYPELGPRSLKRSHDDDVKKSKEDEKGSLLGPNRSHQSW